MVVRWQKTAEEVRVSLVGWERCIREKGRWAFRPEKGNVVRRWRGTGRSAQRKATW